MRHQFGYNPRLQSAEAINNRTETSRVGGGFHTVAIGHALKHAHPAQSLLLNSWPL